MTRTVLTLGVLGVAFAVLLGPPAAAQDKDKGSAKLAGGYTIVAGEKYGQPVPKDRIEGSIARFTDDKVTVTDKNTKETYVATYKLGEAKASATTITMTSTLGPSKGETVKGLIAMDGDTLKLIYALPGGEMPTDFKTKDKQLMFMMKNMNK